MHDYLHVDYQYHNPANDAVEIVERKGFGHPDTLANGIAEAVSTKYSRFCLEHYKVVPHHHVDKVYIGGGLFRVDFGICEMIKPINIVINGRMSNQLNGKPIDITKIQHNAALDYIQMILPHLDREHVRIDTNATQHSQRPYWYAPRSIEDIPEYTLLNANDTSVCVAHYPMTVCERLALELEHFFWTYEGGQLKPKYLDIGQDIKVMVSRRNRYIDITLCVPLLSRAIDSAAMYQQRIREIERELQNVADHIVNDQDYQVLVRVNPLPSGSEARQYLLGIGSCIECGEEGVVGRGNASNGIISICRNNSMEAPYGKNPLYHTGRVYTYLTQQIARTLYERFEVKSTIMALTKNAHALLPPALLRVSLDQQIPSAELNAVLEEIWASDYLTGVLDRSLVV